TRRAAHPLLNPFPRMRLVPLQEGDSRKVRVASFCVMCHTFRPLELWLSRLLPHDFSVLQSFRATAEDARKLSRFHPLRCQTRLRLLSTVYGSPLSSAQIAVRQLGPLRALPADR